MFAGGGYNKYLFLCGFLVYSGSMILFIGLSFILSLISMPLIIKFCKRYSLYDSHNARKIHSGDIPRIGGVGIAFSFLVSAILYLVFSDGVRDFSSVPVLVAGFIIFLFGLLDDILELPAVAKLMVQLVAVSIVTFSGYRFTQICGWRIPTVLSFVLTFGWILGVINAYNLIDGLDGLCGSLSFSGFVTLGILYMLAGSGEAGLCFILAASVLGFLCFNWPPAKLFMGDDGSQFLGFMIAVAPLYTTAPALEYNKFLIMILLTSFPVFDTIAAIWRRLRDRKPVMSPDRSHLHHKLLNMGYTKKTALYLIVFIQILICGVAVLSFYFKGKKGALLLAEAIVFMVIFFSVIHYTNRAVIKKNSADGNLPGQN